MTVRHLAAAAPAPASPPGAAIRHAAESEVRAALELMPQLVWTTTPDGYHDYYNQRWYDFTGMPKPGDPTADAEGWNWNRYLHPDDYTRTVEVWSGCLATGSPYEIEYRFREAATGAYRWFLGRALPLRDEAGRIVRWFGTCTDIHDHVLTRERLAESEERYRNATQHSAIGHALVSLHGRFLQVNAALCRIVGYRAEELTRMSFQDITHPDDLESDLAQAARLRAGEIDSYQMEKRYWHASGESVWIHLTGSLVRDPEGRPMYFIAQVQDLTERRTLERQLRESQKLEAVGRLAGGVAHDFNNLLTVISNYAELVLEDLPAGSPSSDDVREIRAAAERGARLTRQLLTFGRRHLRRPSEIDIGPMLRDSENLFRQLAGAHTEVLVDAGEGGIVHADPSEIDQILLNLVLNARDAMPTGGVLQVTCDVVSGDAAAIPGAPRSDACVRIVVSDTGSGIADDVLPHIFEPFFTTKGDRGTGLGLSTVHGIVTRNGGTVGVQTQPGVGTRFEVRLPRYGRPDDLATPGPTEAAAPAVSGTVLLVEDEVSLRNACRRVLERGGLRVIEARHGADGLRRWAEHGGAIDAVVTDLVMPEMGGRELAEALRRERPDLPVLFVSGYTDDPLARRAIEDPSVTFLAKPFAPADLLATVRGMLAAAQS